MGDSSARHRRRRRGLPTYRLIRYADDFVVMVHGTGAHAEGLRTEVAAVLAPLGLRLSQAKTRTVHIDEGFDFLGFRIQRQPKRGSGKPTVYTYPSKKALASIVGKVKKICRHDPNLELAPVLHQLNRALRGWTAYFRPGVSFATFAYLRAFTWRQVMNRLRRKHRRINWKDLRRRYCDGGWWPKDVVQPRGGAPPNDLGGRLAGSDEGRTWVAKARSRSTF